MPLGVWRTTVEVNDTGQVSEHPPTLHAAAVQSLRQSAVHAQLPYGGNSKARVSFVPQHYGRCTACRTCFTACPYNARHVLLNNGASVKTGGVVDECVFCEHRVAKGLLLACLLTCLGRSQISGDIAAGQPPRYDAARK